MRQLFQSIEQFLGPSLDTVANIAYWVGVALLIHRVAAPLLRLRMEMVSARLKLQHGVVMECPYCHRETLVHDAQCGFCRQSLTLPWSVRAWHFLRLRREPPWWQWTQWTWDSLGLAAFLVLTVAGFIGLHAWNPAGPLQKLFLGVALNCWVAIGWLLGHALNLRAVGPIARLRDVFFALALSGVFAASLLLAVEARPVVEQVLWRVPVGEGAIARIGNQSLPLPQGVIGFEYLQVDHDLLGYHRVIPLAFLGAQRLELRVPGLEKWLVDNLWRHAPGYTERGLSVRNRVEQFSVVPNRNYEVVERDRQVFFRPAQQ